MKCNIQLSSAEIKPGNKSYLVRVIDFVLSVKIFGHAKYQNTKSADWYNHHFTLAPTATVVSVFKLQLVLGVNISEIQIFSSSVLDQICFSITCYTFQEVTFRSAIFPVEW